MITVTYNSIDYECTTALKGTDYIHLLDANGEMIASFDGVSDFTGFTITGGSWTTPTSNDDCYLAVVGDDGVIRKGGHKCSDIGTKAIHKTITIPYANWTSVSGDSDLFLSADGVTIGTSSSKTIYYANYSKFLNETNYPYNTFKLTVGSTAYTALASSVSGNYRNIFFVSTAYASSIVLRIYKDLITITNNTASSIVVKEVSNTVDGASYKYVYSNSDIKTSQSITVSMPDADRLVAREADLWDIGDLATGKITFYCGSVPSQALHLVIDGLETTLTYDKIRVIGSEQISEDELSDDLKNKLDNQFFTLTADNFIDSNSNLDDFTDVGTYSCQTDAIAQTTTNLPSGVSVAFKLIVSQIGNEYAIRQQLQVNGSNCVNYERYYDAPLDTWYEWKNCGGGLSGYIWSVTKAGTTQYVARLGTSANWFQSGDSSTCQYYISDTITINQSTGAIKQNNTSYLTVAPSSADLTQFRGKYVKNNTRSSTAIYFVTSSATYLNDDGSHYFTNCQLVSSVQSVTPDTVTYEVTANEDDHTEGEVNDDGGVYHLLGDVITVLGKSVGVETGTYTGTGTYGASNKNTLVFSAPPKVVLIAIATSTYPNSSNGVKILFGNGTNTITWADTSVGTQLNINATNYNYFALL